MKAVALLGLFLALSSWSANAADSTWLLCDNGSLVINTLERRAGGDNRSTSLTLIYGMHVLRGELLNADAGSISLDGSEPGALKTFKGSISINYQMNTISLRGALNLYGSPSRVSTLMKCKLMKN